MQPLTASDSRKTHAIICTSSVDHARGIHNSFFFITISTICIMRVVLADTKINNRSDRCLIHTNYMRA
jgi:hypothetical protein